MNIERTPLVPKRRRTNEQLDKKLYTFANVLAHGRWFDQTAYRVETSQTFVERLGGEYSTPEIDVEPIYNEVTISFSAVKQNEEDEDGRVYPLPRYVITSTVRQDVDKSEIPEYVLDEIFQNAQEGHEAAHDVLDEAGFGDVLDGRKWSDVSEDMGDNLDQFEIKREQEVEYEVSYDGTIADYSASHSYSFDDTVLHTADYRQSDGTVHMEPVTYAQESITDRRPIYIPTLTAKAIEEYRASLDSQAEAFFVEQSIRSLEQVAQLPEEEHIRRIMGMVGMVSSGYTPRRWYTRAYDGAARRFRR